PSPSRYDQERTESGGVLEEVDDFSAGAKIRRTRPVSELKPEVGDDPARPKGKAAEVNEKDVVVVPSNAKAAASEAVFSRGSPGSIAGAASRCLPDELVSCLLLCLCLRFLNKLL
ncbi:hypothetical protein MTO96_006345, partial [Rhipicephalus appendiculatus]